MRALPDHILQALQAWAMVTKDRTASDSSFGCSFKEVWSKRKRGIVFGSNSNPLATKFTGVSVCHPLYDDSVMLNMVRHAIYSSISTESVTATFLLLPNCKGLNANAYMQILTKYPEHCTILGTIPQASVTYRRQDLWIGNNTSSPAPEQDLEIIVIWNNEAQHMLFDEHPRWCAALSNAIPEAIFQPCPHPPTQNMAKVIKIPRSFRKKLNDSAFTQNTRSITTAPNLTALTNNYLRLKVPDWRLWACTDGSCLTYKSQQRVGAGVFIPATKTAIYVNSGGVGISNRTDWHSFCTKGKVYPHSHG